MTIRGKGPKNPRNKLGRSRAGERKADRQSDWDLRCQLQKRRRGRDPQVKGAARTKRTPTCPVCRDVKVLRTKWVTSPLCQGCWNAFGCPSDERSEEIAEEHRKKNLARDAGDAKGPW